MLNKHLHKFLFNNRKNLVLNSCTTLTDIHNSVQHNDAATTSKIFFNVMALLLNK